MLDKEGEDVVNIFEVIEKENAKENLKPRLRHFHKVISNLGMTKAMNATRFVENEMSAEKGYTRHNGESYYVHPIALAQAALDLGLVELLIKRKSKDYADDFLTVCLLHDVLEDLDDGINEYVIENYGNSVYQNVLNVTKIKGEAFDKYLVRVISSEMSALVKILDQFNNISTMSQSTLAHRKKHYEIARKYYLPLISMLRRRDWEFGGFYFQIKYILNALLDEIQRSIETEEKNTEFIEGLLKRKKRTTNLLTEFKY